MAYDKCNLEPDSSIGASSIPARVNIGARVPSRRPPTAQIGRYIEVGHSALRLGAACVIAGYSLEIHS